MEKSQVGKLENSKVELKIKVYKLDNNQQL
jgi:hypothetical protein